MWPHYVSFQIFHWCKSYLWHWSFFITKVHFLFDSISNPRPFVWILWRAKISLTSWYHRFTIIPFSTFILVCFWQMVNLHNYFWNLTVRLHNDLGLLEVAPFDEYYYFFREINFRRYLKWNRIKEKLKSQTYFWGTIVAGDNIVLVFLLCLYFYIHHFYSYIIWNQWIRGFLKLFSSIFIFSLGFSMYLHKTSFD